MGSEDSSLDDAGPIVAYRLRTGPGLRCVRCAPNPAGCDWTPLASEDLPDGGICTACGTDVLIDSLPDDPCVCGHARRDHHAVARSCEASACFCSDPTYPAKPVCTCQAGTWGKFDSPEDCEAHGANGASTEPPGSASSSPDEKCTCGCTRAAHMGKPRGCLRHGFHAFVPADAETAGEPECACGAEECEICTPMRHLAAEPEALEDDHACAEGATLYYCPTAGEVESSCHGGFDVCCSAPEQHIQVDPPPRRPPYAVAYATEDGTQYEVALPGDATIRAEGGALIVTHASAVQGLTQARPMEGA